MPPTLRPCLESVAQLGMDYVGTDQGTEWTPREMVAALTRDSPDHLDRLMCLRLPASQQDGAICELIPRGGFLLRSRICRHASRG